jgi:hypothetical protein
MASAEDVEMEVQNHGFAERLRMVPVEIFFPFFGNENRELKIGKEWIAITKLVSSLFPMRIATKREKSHSIAK